MPPRTKKTKSKLGHDPLAWLGNEPSPVADSEEHQVSEKVEDTEETEASETVAEQIEEVTTQPVEPESPGNEGQEDQNSKGNAMLELPIYFGIAQVGEVYENMKTVAENAGEEVKIKADDIESIDAAALQLLLVFIKQLKANGKQVKFTGLSDKLNAAVDLLGVESSFS